MSFDQWNLIFEKEIEIKKLNKILDDLNKSPLILATNISDSQVFFEIQGKNSFDILNKLTHFDFREKSFKKSTAAQTLLARVDCSIFNLDLKLSDGGKSFKDLFIRLLNFESPDPLNRIC